MRYKLIATDFDGTLLTDDKHVTDITIQKLLNYKSQGYKIVGVTARALGSTKYTIPIDIFDYLILNNGAYIYDVGNSNSRYIGILNQKIVSDIISLVENDQNHIDIVSDTTYYSYKDNKKHDVTYIKIVDSIDEIDECIMRMNIFVDNLKLDHYCNLISKKFPDINCFIMQDSDALLKWLVVNPKGINKKTTLELLGNELNVDLEEMIFFGDGLNDLEVIKAVGLGVAMGNALDEVKECAKDITLSNNDNGVVYYLDKLLGKEV